jgi:predicted nucleic acid-binding protein
MSDRFFLDTNIFVYSFDRGAVAKSRRATQLIRTALKTQKGIISYQVVQEFFNVALQRFTQSMKVDEAEQYYSTILRPLLGIHSSEALFLDALHWQSRYRLSWYDSLIVAAAIQAQCQVLMTEDLPHGQQFGDLRIENPFLSQAS